MEIAIGGTVLVSPLFMEAEIFKKPWLQLHNVKGNCKKRVFQDIAVHFLQKISKESWDDRSKDTYAIIIMHTNCLISLWAHQQKLNIHYPVV